MPKSKIPKPRSRKIEEEIVRLLAKQKRTLTLAESCTGGCIANSVTNVSGASEIFPGGVVTYSNEAKRKILGVRAGTLSRHGGVSQAVAREMAEGALKKFQADYAIAVTGIAGPTGGTATKPVGTVFIALASKRETKVWKEFNPLGRLAFKRVTTKQALKQLHLRLKRAR